MNRLNIRLATIITIILLGVFTCGLILSSLAYSAQNNNNSFSIPSKLTKQWVVLESLSGVPSDYYHGVAVGSDGSIYVTDVKNGVIKKIYPNWRSIDLGGGFNYPQGVAVDDHGNVYVADSENNAVKMIYPNGSVKAIGSGFRYPCGIAVDKQGNVYVADSYNSAIKMIYPNNTTVKLGDLLDPRAGDQNYYIETMNTGNVFNDPQGIAVDGLGNVYVANFYGGINKIYPNDTTIWLAEDHPFRNLQGIAVDAYGNIYVSERNNRSVDLLYPNGTLLSFGGYSHPAGVAVDSQGNLYVADDYSISEHSPPQNASVLPYVNWIGNLSICTLIPLLPIIAIIVFYAISAGIKNRRSSLRAMAWLFLKLYLYGAIIYFVVFNITIYILESVMNRWDYGFSGLSLLQIFLFASFWSATCGIVHLSRISSKEYPITSETIKVDHSREITVSLGYIETFNLCVSSLGEINNYKIQFEDRESGKVEARTPWLSKGGSRKITFQIQKEPNSNSRILIGIKPIIPTPIDYGYGLYDIETISKYIIDQSHLSNNKNNVQKS